MLKLDLAQGSCGNPLSLAWAEGEDALYRVWVRYVDNVIAYVDRSTVMDLYTGANQPPDERLMRIIEDELGYVPEQGVDDYRRGIAVLIGMLHIRKKDFTMESMWEIITPEFLSYPQNVKELAKSLDGGIDCSFALHDALMEMGDKNAAHFLNHASGPCWITRKIHS